MYIEYETPQRVATSVYTKYDSKGGDFRPTWLIRTSDWQKVPGNEATDGYHTLSYCWEQSGEKFLKSDGEYDLEDDGLHRIVKMEKEERRISNLFRHRQQVPVTYEVTYDELLQQVCKDFDIEYLWYDKTCIDQTNKAEKHREIKQMHLIYSHARYTLALVPEINIEDPEDFDREPWYSKDTQAKSKALYQMLESLWWKRSWTLEEVMMSTRILIVGRNTHFWSLAISKQGDEIKERDFLSGMLGFTELEIKSANQVLCRAHFRTSTKPHDKIYALANIFHGMVDIDIDYSIDVSTVINEFYRQLAEKDLSIMCFGSNLLPSGNPRFATTMASYGLPSWTGVAGLHSQYPIANITLDRNCDYTIDDNMQLHITCRSYAIRPVKDNGYCDFLLDEERWEKADENYDRVITSMDDFGGFGREALDWSQYCMTRATGCSPTHYHKPDDHVPFPSPILPLSLTEDCDECVILGVVFDSAMETVTADGVPVGYDHNYLSPVARKSADGSSYKIIGVILLKHFPFYETRLTPQEVMDRMFDNLGCERQAFCIE